MIILYGLKNCDTCRKALKALSAAGKDVSFVDIRAGDVSEDMIIRWEALLGHAAMLNTRSTTWRSLGAEDKTDINSETAIALMTEHRALIKRPILEANGKTYSGWTPQTRGAFGLE